MFITKAVYTNNTSRVYIAFFFKDLTELRDSKATLTIIISLIRYIGNKKLSKYRTDISTLSYTISENSERAILYPCMNP